MANWNNIEATIENLRKVSERGDLVTYDLTDKIDFSKPKEFAKALADVFFRKDAINWFKVTDDKIEFNPAYKVRIILAWRNQFYLSSHMSQGLHALKPFADSLLLPQYYSSLPYLLIIIWIINYTCHIRFRHKTNAIFSSQH